MLLTQSLRPPPSPPGHALCLAEVDPACLPGEGVGFQIEQEELGWLSSLVQDTVIVYFRGILTIITANVPPSVPHGVPCSSPCFAGRIPVLNVCFTWVPVASVSSPIGASLNSTV